MTTETAKRPAHRPVTTGTTPAKLRQAKSLQELRNGGGEKIAARLPAKSFGHLKAIKSARGLSTTEAVIYALEVAAKRLK